MKTSVIKRHLDCRFLVISEDYLSICRYEIETPKMGISIKTNDCAAALLALYEHRHNAFLANNENHKGKIKQSSGLGFLEKCLLGHYSQKSIREANAFLAIKGFISIESQKVSENENAPNLIVLNVDAINNALNLSEEKNYPTIKLQEGWCKITGGGAVKLQEGCGKITESNIINDNLENKDNNNLPQNENSQNLDESFENTETVEIPKTKAAKGGRAAKKEKGFLLRDAYKNSFDFEVRWSLHLQENQKHADEFLRIDISKVYDSMLSWSNNKLAYKIDWIMTAVNWIRGEKNKDKYSYTSKQGNNQVEQVIRHLSGTNKDEYPF
jgi:hypothetical protein